MRETVKNRLISFLMSLPPRGCGEGLVSYMYLDQKSLVSVGIGFLIDGEKHLNNGVILRGADNALYIKGWIRKIDGAPATNDEIRAEWTMVKNSNKAGKWKELEKPTNLRLPQPVIENLVVKIANENIKYLTDRSYPWNDYPADGQLGLLSVLWSGIGRYPELLKHLKNGNWFYAAGEATFRDLPHRQKITQRLLNNAGRVVARDLDRNKIWYDDPTDMGRAFFLRGGEYLSCNIFDESLEKDRPQPSPIDSETNRKVDWPGFKKRGFHERIDTAVNYGNGNLYLFKGSRYISYNIASNSTDGPFFIDSGNKLPSDWNGMKAVGFSEDLDAAINWGDGRVFFFKDDSYITYDKNNNKVIDVRRPIDSSRDTIHDWAGMKAAGFSSDIDAAINWGDGRVFFFKDDRYVKFLIHPGKVETGYPLTIERGWSTLAQKGYKSNIGAALDVG